METGALQGLRVVDLTRVVAGPLCTQILADHGAEVVKIEAPEGDGTRRLGPPFDAHGDAAYFSGLNRNKRSIALDLGSPAGREVLLRLIAGADVVIENFLPGTMKKWGLDYQADLAPRFPRLVYCSVTGFGADGPMGGKPGYDAVGQALGGLMSVNGFPETGPTRVGIPVVDLATGMNATIAILLALAERTRSGRGQRVEATLFDSVLALLHPHAANTFMGGAAPGLPGNSHHSISTYDTYQAADGKIFLGIINEGQFRKFCALLGREDVPADERFATNASRMANRPALRQAIEGMLREHTASSLCERLMAAGIPAAVVRSVPQALSDPHAAHRGMVVSRGTYRGINAAQALSRTPASLRSTPPKFAADTRQILAGAGYTADEIETLVASGVAPLERRVN
ncbi:MAG: CaiB/BaiF CoA transferase family protein [Betaproteobacteria bacterium]